MATAVDCRFGSHMALTEASLWQPGCPGLFVFLLERECLYARFLLTNTLSTSLLLGQGRYSRITGKELHAPQLEDYIPVLDGTAFLTAGVPLLARTSQTARLSTALQPGRRLARSKGAGPTLASYS